MSVSRKSLKRKLGKKVLAGEMTAAAAKARLGRGMVQKSRGPGKAGAAGAGICIPAAGT